MAYFFQNLAPFRLALCAALSLAGCGGGGDEPLQFTDAGSPSTGANGNPLSSAMAASSPVGDETLPLIGGRDDVASFYGRGDRFEGMESRSYGASIPPEEEPMTSSTFAQQADPSMPAEAPLTTSETENRLTPPG